jgi:hypothetical protein
LIKAEAVKMSETSKHPCEIMFRLELWGKPVEAYMNSPGPIFSHWGTKVKCDLSHASDVCRKYSGTVDLNKDGSGCVLVSYTATELVRTKSGELGQGINGRTELTVRWWG